MFAMNPPPTVGLKTLIIFGLSFVKQLAHGLVKRFADYVTLLNAFVLVWRKLSLGSCHLELISRSFQILKQVQNDILL